jgi:hypothetical protein
MSFCHHHLVSVVCHPFTFQILIFSSENPRPNGFIWLSSFRGEDFFRNRPIRNKNCMWWPCLLTDRDEMSIFHRGHSIDASYQVSVHLVKTLGQMNWNLGGSIYGRSSLKITHFVSIHLQTWPPQAILVSEYSSDIISQGNWCKYAFLWDRMQLYNFAWGNVRLN